MQKFAGRAFFLGALGLVALGLGAFGEEAWVVNRVSNTVSTWQVGATLPAAPSATATVGNGPLDIAPDRALPLGPTRLFVANSGSSTVSVLGISPFGVTSTISGDVNFGSLTTPSGITEIESPNIGPTVAVSDQTVTSGFLPVGRSTVRFIDPVGMTIVDGFRDPSPTARYEGLVATQDLANGGIRIWVADDGDQGVVVIRIPGDVTGPPFQMGDTLFYNGNFKFADFIHDTASPPTFLVSPRRLATDGTFVVVADGGSNLVTVLDANYVPSGVSGEPGAVLQKVALPAGSTALDVVIVPGVPAGTAFVTTSAAAVVKINLATFTASAPFAPGTSVGGVGATSDGATLFVGQGSDGATLYQFGVATFPAVASTNATLAGTGPVAFYSAPPNSTIPTGGGGFVPGAGGPPIVLGTSGNGGSSTHHCGLAGIEVLLVLAALRWVRRKA